MKAFRIIAVSLFCTMLFCSCNRNYEELIEGNWQVDMFKSYYVEDGKRNYFSDERNGAPFMRIQFENGLFYIDDGRFKKNNSSIIKTDNANIDDPDIDDPEYRKIHEYLKRLHKVEEAKRKNEEAKRKGNYHIDKDFIYIKGDGAQISKMNITTMVLENAEVHIELYRIEYNLWMFLRFINSLPFWIRLIAWLVFVSLADYYWSKVKINDGNSWLDWKSILFFITLVLCIFISLILFDSTIFLKQ